MTIEEFFHACENARLTTVFKVFSFVCPIYNGTFEKMPGDIKNLHVQTFYMKKGEITVYTREMRRWFPE